ncbi:MAG TPA: hypothetical protein DEA08_27565, partial [Planctomycetes bacterium]|nr:hypothetical protein [Planctomycetota bacterium]
SPTRDPSPARDPKPRPRHEPEPHSPKPSPTREPAPSPAPAPTSPELAPVELQTVGEALRYVAGVRRELYRDHVAALEAVERLKGPSLDLWRPLRTLNFALQRAPDAFAPQAKEAQRERVLELIRRAPKIATQQGGELPAAVGALLDEWSSFVDKVDRLRRGLRSELFQTLPNVPRLPEGHPGQRQVELLAELAHAIDDSQRWWNLRERAVERLRPLLVEAKRELGKSALAALLPHEVAVVGGTLEGLVADPRTSLFAALYPQRDLLAQSVFAQARLSPVSEREKLRGQGVLLRAGPMRVGLEVLVDGGPWLLKVTPQGIGFRRFQVASFRWSAVRWPEGPLSLGIELRPASVLLTLPGCEPSRLEFDGPNPSSSTLRVSTLGRHPLRRILLLSLPRLPPQNTGSPGGRRGGGVLDDIFGRGR